MVKFRNYPPMDAKWMEEGELVESPHVLQFYLEAFQLQPTLTPIISKEQRSENVSHAQERDDNEASTSLVCTDLVL